MDKTIISTLQKIIPVPKSQSELWEIYEMDLDEIIRKVREMTGTSYSDSDLFEVIQCFFDDFNEEFLFMDW